MGESLLEALNRIEDPREASGRRYSLPLILLIIIMAGMRDEWGYRGIGRFIERHRRELIKTLQIPQARVPSYSTVRRVMMELDFEQVAKVFNQWARQYVRKGDVVAGDGKSLKNTVENYDNNSQDFVTAISLFCQQRKIALGIKMSRNKQESEISVIQQLLEELDLPPVTVTLDALHTQKNSSATPTSSA
nr:ISAs1 family transposase [[Leptolyngbya] sp. PCC 7376]